MEAHKKARWGILPSIQRSSDSIKITILNKNNLHKEATLGPIA